ncbi:hypothetical protein Nstercoris_00157 [Nitrosomonas stercoris]|uniref:SF3 helicase domain-containing protein n=1 Tax=Nitrosomonas stercoris TaxID=1444684 RepID=A0A4Y1YIK4_9PROT|nr:hypothetical protein Nstercoris_00157 [Nitrosomonas stercoris]
MELDHGAIAEAAIAKAGRENLLSNGVITWHWKNDGVWRECPDVTLKKMSLDVLKRETQTITSSKINGAKDVIVTTIAKPHLKFNQSGRDFVNCLNGSLIIDDNQWTLKEHKREDYAVTQIPVAYDPAATAPRFSQFLTEIFPDDKDSQAAILEMLGYTLMPHCRHERFVILIGGSANGKSVLLRVVEGLCGRENVAAVQPAQFDRTFQRAHLHNKLANIVSEIEQGQVIADEALKGIVSGEPSTVEHKHKPPFEMVPFATCWFGTNHMPHTRDFSDGLFRRALILKFRQVFKPELGNHDATLAQKLSNELPGILNLALEAYRAAVVNGFTEPEASKVAKDEWRLEANQVAQFVDEECERATGTKETLAGLYGAYKEWAMTSGINKTLTKTSFGGRLQLLGFEKCRTASGMAFVAIRLNASSVMDYQQASRGF